MYIELAVEKEGYAHIKPL